MLGLLLLYFAYHQVLNEELLALQRGCTVLQADYKPSITFLVVQKRHHTRFFAANPNDGVSSSIHSLVGSLQVQASTSCNAALLL